MAIDNRPAIKIELTHYDVELILMALSLLHTDKMTRRHKTAPIDVLFTKIYRAMGVKI